MPNSKIQLSDGTILLDLTGDTVTPAVLGSGYKAHSKSGEAITGTATLSSDLSFSNKSVAVSAWAADTTYADYPFRAAIACSGATDSHFPDVVFSETDAASGVFSPIAASYAGGVYIYAGEKPTAAVTIPTIYLNK